LSGLVTDIVEPTADDPIPDIHSTGLLEHHETELCSPSHCFGSTVRIELGENGGDVKLGGVEGDSQPTCDRFVGDAVCHRSKYFELAGG